MQSIQTRIRYEYLVDKILECCRDTKSCVSPLKREIDELVHKLYYLTPKRLPS